MSDASIPASTLRQPTIPFRERRSVIFVSQCFFILSIFALWEFASGRLVSPFFIGAPSVMFAILWDWLTTGFIWIHIGYTLVEACIGFVIGAGLAVVFGLVLGSDRRLYDLFDPFISALYSIPKIALAPVLIIWFGLGMASKIVLAAMIVFFLVFHATVAGLRNVDLDLIDQVRIMGGKRRDVLAKVTIPSVMLNVLNGLRISFPFALHGAILGEIIASQAGLGYMLEFSRGRYDMSMMYASLLLLMVISVAIVTVINSIEKIIPKPE